MVNVHKKTSALLCVIVGIVLLIGIMSGCTPSHNKEVDTVTLTTNIEMKSDLQNVAQNGAIINSASFNIKETSKDVFVRANVRYYVDREMTNEDRKFLTSINYDGIETISGTGYKWARGSDGYYYLVNSNTGLPFKVNGADTTEYKLCENVVYKGVKSIGETRAPKELKLKVELQAINAKNITATTLEGVALKFKDFFGNNDTLGYIVTFNANGATNPPAQVFLDNNSTVTCPETPSKVGYIFEGWYTDSNYNTVYTFTNTVTNSFTLYAKFVEGKKVTITKGDNIESVTVTTNRETIKNGDLVPVGATLTIAVTPASGYKASWTITSGGVTLDANETNITANDDIIISVTARQLKNCLVSFTQDENISAVTVTSADGEPISSGDYVIEDSVLSITITPASGYIASWTVTNGTTTESANATSVTIKGDVTINAVGEIPPPPYTFGQYTSGTFENYYYVDMGTYPQSKVTDVTADTLTDAYKTTKSYSLKSANDCPVYEYNGEEYIKYNTPTTDTTQVVYKVEPVRWLILGKVTGDQTSGDQTTVAVTSADFTVVDNKYTYTGSVKNLLLLSEKTLIQQEFNQSLNKWNGSLIQTFMNDTFIKELFTTKQQSMIQDTTLKTTWYNGDLHANDTAEKSIDKLFLLGGKQINGDNIYKDTFSVEDCLSADASKRISKVSDIGYATGCEKCEGDHEGDTFWWLRAGCYNNASYAQFINAGGNFLSYHVRFDLVGVRPAFVMTVA